MKTKVNKSIIGKLSDDFKDVEKFKELSLNKIWNNKEDDVWEEYLN